MAAKPKPKKKSEGEIIYKRVNDWEGVTVAQKKGDDLSGPTVGLGRRKKKTQHELELAKLHLAYEEHKRGNQIDKAELEHEKYLHGITKAENKKLMDKRKATYTEIKRLREENQALKGYLAQAVRKVADLSRPWWKRFRKMDEETLR